jgi:hypothetical protein
LVLIPGLKVALKVKNAWKFQILTDLDLAIFQADDYRQYRHADPCIAAHDAALLAYCEDVYGKLPGLRSKKNTPPCLLRMKAATSRAACRVA